MEGTESAAVFGSGMGAITATLMQLCQQGDHIVASRTIYGGTFAFMKNFLPRLGIATTFVDLQSPQEVEKAMKPETRVIYGESLSNPLLRVANLPELARISERHGAKLVVDNTFSPLLIQPCRHGAHIVIHSLTKFINGNNDTLGGVVCGTTEFTERLKDVNEGAAMLLGSTLDSLRANQILKNLQTLPLRIRRHSENAAYLADALKNDGYAVSYPGLASHPDHELMSHLHTEEYGFGGMLTLNAENLEKADRFMQSMQNEGLGYLAVSLGYHKTLFSASGSSTSSEIPEAERGLMGLGDGLVRFSVGLDEDIERSREVLADCLIQAGLAPGRDSFRV